MIDTHTADAIKVAREHREAGVPIVVLETAQPVKFAETIEALGRDPVRPKDFDIQALPATGGDHEGRCAGSQGLHRPPLRVNRPAGCLVRHMPEAGEDYLFGTAPNKFPHRRHRRNRARTACPVADGEGRNSVFLAEGLAVTAVEISPVGLHRARRLAASHVAVDFVQADVPMAVADDL